MGRIAARLKPAISVLMIFASWAGTVSAQTDNKPDPLEKKGERTELPVPVRAGARVKVPADTTPRAPLPICEAARVARERNSPAAPGLERQCQASRPANNVAEFAPTMSVTHAPTNFSEGLQTTFKGDGAGWEPWSNVDLTLFSEPQRNADGEVYSAPPRIVPVGSVVDGFGRLYFEYTVTRNICGQPPHWLPKPFFMARDQARGLSRFVAVPNDKWFTYKTCT